jgi:hypothetical protein
MPWDEERFGRFVDAVTKMARGALPGYGHPHVVMPYAPRDELRCIEEIQGLPTALASLGINAQVFPVAHWVARVLRRYSKRELRTADDYRHIEQDLADPNVGLVPTLVEHVRREILPALSAQTLLVLGRLGALYPFAHVSTFLDGLYGGGIRNPVAVLYPGTADGTQLRFLGLVDPTGGYRGHVVT